MEIKTQLIKIGEIGTHPSQKRIYGETVDVNDEFLTSIGNRGILQPLLVAKCNEDVFNKDEFEEGTKYVVIAGHRRLQALIVIGHTTAPCVIRDYNSFDETEADLIISNSHRKKTNQMRIMETKQLQQISSQNPELFNRLYLEALEKRKLDKLVTELPETNKEVYTSDKIGAIQGKSNTTVKQEFYIANALNKKIDLFEKDDRGRLPIDLEKEIEKEWDEVVDSCKKDLISPSVAYKQLKALEKRIDLEMASLKKKRMGFDREQKAKAKARAEEKKAKNKVIKAREKASIFKSFERAQPEYITSMEFKEIVVDTVYLDTDNSEILVYDGEYIGRIDMFKLLKKLQEEANQ